MRHHLRHIHLSPKPLGPRFELIDARNQFFDVFPPE
jgi:hypothetical protein